MRIKIIRERGKQPLFAFEKAKSKNKMIEKPFLVCWQWCGPQAVECWRRPCPSANVGAHSSEFESSMDRQLALEIVSSEVFLAPP